MKLKDYRTSEANYNIGIDAGTGSCGWAVVDDESGDLCYFKGRPTWGSRIYTNAETAAKSRRIRGQRRRIIRRRQRINLLQEFFAPEISNVDSEFFNRLNNSFKVADDRDFHHPVFNGSDFAESQYYQQFPTIYHLRKFLMETDEKQDIRLIYIAFHNIVKYRGNFLYQENKGLTAKNANAKNALKDLVLATNDFYEQKGFEDFNFEIDVDACEKIIEDTLIKRADKKDELTKLFVGLSTIDKKLPEHFAKAVLGYSVDFNKIFGDEDSEDKKFDLTNEEKVEEFQEKLDDGLALFEALQAVYSSSILMNILQGEDSISVAKVKSYEDYKKDLKHLKSFIRKFSPDKYDSFFRGELYEDGSGYNPAKAKGYTLYNLKRGAADRKKFIGEVKAIFETLLKSDQDPEEQSTQKTKDKESIVEKVKALNLEAEDEECILSIMSRIEDDSFLKRQKTGESGAIPFQLHLEEMNAIIDKQGKFYKFLIDEKDKLNSIVTFRIPYYVGPLTTKSARKDAFGENRFAWSERIEGKESEKIYPWNWDKIIDKDKSANNFMSRMIGTCTYIYQERVLPKCSLVYEFFCVLNELNGAKFSEDGDKKHRFDTSTRQGIVKNLFMRKKTVSYESIKKWLKENNKCLTENVEISGAQGDKGFVSKLSSWNDFCNILGVETLSEAQFEMAEEVILWKSLYQDKDILKRKIKDAYGEVLDSSQIKKISKKNYSGWGRLSDKLLREIKANTDNGQKSIMDILWEGNQNNLPKFPIGASQIFMEIYHDDYYGFEEIVDKINEEKIEDLSVQSLPGSPALKRTVNQAMRIVDEIVRLAGKAPKNIFIEYTRDDDEKKKGKRTTTRYESVEKALEQFKEEDEKVWEEFKNKTNDDLADDRLFLYFLQRGKCMYSGEELDIDKLDHYHVDHIIPQCYIKDDSLDNKVLVLSKENERKLDDLLLSPSVRKKMKDFWEKYHTAKLISDKKFNNLTRENISEKAIKGFIARQLVETNQIVKFMKDLLAQEYPETNVHFVKASVTSGLREKCDFFKCREINDFHHAHDAYLACRVGMFIKKRHPVAYENPIAMTKVVQDFVKKTASGHRPGKNIPGSGGFFVSCFLKSGFNKETGEVFEDDWNAEAEIARIKKVLNYKQVYISRMVEEKVGAFWDSNVVSPRLSNNTLLVKEGLDPKKYGSYNNLNPSYGCVYLCEDKKGRKKIKFASIPVVKRNDVRDYGKLEAYLATLCEDSKLKLVKIIRPKILLNQLLELEGNLFYYVSPKEVRNAMQMAFSQYDTMIFKKIFKGEIPSEEDVDRLVKEVFDFIYNYAPELYMKMKADTIKENYDSNSIEQKVELLKMILPLIKAEKDRFNSKPFGGSSGEAGRMSSYSLETRADKIVLIDQSVTGMLEKRTRLADM